MQPDGVAHVIQVRPNPLDRPEERKLQLWAAVRHANGTSAISGVTWRLYAPDGRPVESEVEGVRLARGSSSQHGGSAPQGSMFAAAVLTGQISAALVDDPSAGLQASCARGDVALYSAVFSLSHRQPCGEYRVETQARSGTRTTTLSSYFDVVCFYFLQFDFDAIEWGTLAAGDTRTLTGDLVFDSPSANSPTVRNAGNDGVALGIRFSPMRRVDPDDAASVTSPGIDQFSACFGRSAETLQCGVANALTRRVAFDDQRERVLCANELGRLDLSVRAGPDLATGQYVGSARVEARPAPRMC